jgi:hypothetical protein
VRLEWESGEPDCRAGFEAQQVSGLAIGVPSRRMQITASLKLRLAVGLVHKAAQLSVHFCAVLKSAHCEL